MRDLLAERLLAEIMEWGPEDVVRERPILEALATLKYDGYQQFRPGTRFIESLARWLAQFGTIEERKTAYGFVRQRLVFLSESEMSHLISMAFPDLIRMELLRIAAHAAQEPECRVRRLSASLEYKTLLRRTLFVGLSDGARTDVFRRCNGEISHDQICQTYRISKDQADNLCKELRRAVDDPEGLFRVLVLLDDFSGSGMSYLRLQGESYDGKIFRVLNDLVGDGPLAGIVDRDDLRVFVVLYVATRRARLHLSELLGRWREEKSGAFPIILLPVQEIPDDACLKEDRDAAFLSLLRGYFDNSIVDAHWKKGRHDSPYLGFDECALPLVLPHNTPNNSLPILWFEESSTRRGLFPRVSRHRGET